MSEFNIDILKDPRIFQQNRMEAHSDHDYYTKEGIWFGDPSDCRMLLNGQWKYAYAKNPSLAPEGFWGLDYHTDDWDEITVPGHIELQGYGHPQYANTQFPWDGHELPMPGEVPERFNPVSSYVRYFTLPDNMKDGSVYISFQGVESAFALWLNGQYVGYSEDSFTPSEFDLTGYVNREGENKLAVRVFRFSSASWCEDQDFFRFSGIFRDVYLFTVPESHIWDLKIQTILDDDYKDAVLQLDLKCQGEGDIDYVLRNRFSDAVFGRVPISSGTLIGQTASGIPIRQVTITATVRSPLKWSAEEPNLYALRIGLYDEGDEETVKELVIEKVGFRRFEIIDHVMCLNGRRIVFKGVNRHEFSAYTGRCISDEEIKKDIVTMKRNNINAVRTSHYPNRTLLYRLCDEYGLYMIDETNLETHGVWDSIIRDINPLEFSVPGDREEFREMVLDRARSMYERDKNHPSILIWSCGNEAYGGKDIFEMAESFRRWDPTRLVHYEGSNWERDPRYPDTSDMNTSMYLPVADLREFLSKEENRNKPYIMCEYAHAMGNSCGALAKYTEYAEEEQLYQGGFIWDYIDQCIMTKDRYGTSFGGYGGDFDDRPNDDSFSGDGLVYGDTREETPKMQEVKYCYQNIFITFKDDEFIVKNQNLFINTNRYVVTVTLNKDGKEYRYWNTQCDVEPLSEKAFPIGLTIPDEEGEYTLTVVFRTAGKTMWADAGHIVAYGQTVFGAYHPHTTETNACRSMRVVRGWWNTGVSGDGFEVVFSNLFGGLTSYRYGGREMMKQAPKPNFWRPMTENDLACLLPFKAGQWKLASLYPTTKYEHGRMATDYEVAMAVGDDSAKGQTASFEKVAVSQVIEDVKDAVTVTYTYHLPTTPAKDCQLSYTVHPDGTVDVHLQMDSADEVGLLPEFGVLFTMDADYDRMKWYGLGPGETYADRNHACLGIYETNIADNFARYLRPQESGNRSGVRYAEVTDASGRGLRFTGKALNFSALPYSPHEIDNARHPNELPPVLYTYVRVALAQMGVGGDDTWGAEVHPEYLIDGSGRLELDFSFRGL